MQLIPYIECARPGTGTESHMLTTTRKLQADTVVAFQSHTLTLVQTMHHRRSERYFNNY
jgi:hypothetical protein